MIGPRGLECETTCWISSAANLLEGYNLSFDLYFKVKLSLHTKKPSIIFIIVLWGWNVKQPVRNHER